METITSDLRAESGSLDEILSLAEAAQIAGLASHTLAQQAAKGQLCARKIGHTWITTKNWLNEYIALHSRRQNQAG